MTTVVETDSLQRYLDEVQRLKVATDEEPQETQNLLNYIVEQKSVHQSSPGYESFFKGEHAFYQENFEQALVHYIKAREVPRFEFFCYRVSAHISFIQGNYERATKFVDKALNIKPLDHSTLTLRQEIFKKKNEEAKKSNPFEERKIAMDINTPIPTTETKEKTNEGQQIKTEATNHFIASKLGVDLNAEKALEERILMFQKLQTDLVQNYLEESKNHRKVKNHGLYILNSRNEKHSSALSQILLGEHSRINTSGFFLRWNDQGIVVNPGPNFLENFHGQGLHLQDINYIIVTKDSPEAYADIKKIYDLNYQLNKINPELQVIHYYLNHKAYKDLSHTLTANFKQERNTVHCLELFLDSPDVEKEEIAEGITLNYFSTTSKGGFSINGDYNETPSSGQAHCLGVRFDLKNNQYNAEEEPIRIGYISGTAWSPLLAQHLGSCDILITGFGNTSPNDYGKLNYNETSLGYFGTYTLLEEVKPRLMLCTEFNGQEGDVRLEVVKKLRIEYQNANPSEMTLPAILPAEDGLLTDLKTLQIECSIGKKQLDPKDVVVVRTKDPFGTLCYLSSKHFL